MQTLLHSPPLDADPHSPWMQTPLPLDVDPLTPGCTPPDADYPLPRTCWEANHRPRQQKEWQECIPVGCVLPAGVSIRGVSIRYPPGADTPQEQTPPRADTPKQTASREQTPPPRSRHAPPPGSRHPPLWTEFLTHAYETCPKLRLRAVNITLSQTSPAGGNDACDVPTLPPVPLTKAERQMAAKKIPSRNFVGGR